MSAPLEPNAGWRQSLAERWRECLCEAALLGTFMVSACSFATLLEHPGSPVRGAIESGFARRSLMGLAMGLTAVLLIYSYPGRRSGAHMNPGTTLSFLRLGRLRRWDAVFYIVAQFLGAASGVTLAGLLLGRFVADPAVNFVVTRPGAWGDIAAWAAEFGMGLLMMTMVLTVNRRMTLAPWTGYFAGFLVFLYITFEAPISGMSLNPARSFGSLLVARDWPSWWVYFTAPPLGMLTAVELQRLLRRRRFQGCCKMAQCLKTPCPFVPCECRAQLCPSDETSRT